MSTEDLQRCAGMKWVKMTPPIDTELWIFCTQTTKHVNCDQSGLIAFPLLCNTANESAALRVYSEHTTVQLKQRSSTQRFWGEMMLSENRDWENCANESVRCVESPLIWWFKLSFFDSFIWSQSNATNYYSFKRVRLTRGSKTAIGLRTGEWAVEFWRRY